MAKRVLVTGASGLFGREILKCFAATQWEVLGLAFSRASGDLKKVDLCDRAQVEAVLDEFRPSVVVHAAAERRPDVVEKQTNVAVALNVDATQTLAELCCKRDTYLLYISSDYVFDGKDPPYAPSAPTNPLNTYGRTKRDGELVILQNPKFGVLRVPILYGPLETLGESAVTVLFSAVLDSSKPAKMCDYQLRYPTHITNCSQVCVGLAEKYVSGGNAAGIWHYSGQEMFTKYKMALVMAESFGLSTDHIVPVREPPGGAPRPHDCHLESSATLKAVSVDYIPFREGIKKVLEPFR